MSQIGNIRDKSVTLDGSGLGTLAANGNRQFLYIQNSSAHDVQVSLSGIPIASIGGAGTTGTVTLKALAASFAIQLDEWVPQNAVTFKGTAGDIIGVFEG